MAYSTRPNLGCNIAFNSAGVPYYDGSRTVPSPPLGTKAVATDGHEWIFAKASAAIASAAVCVLTEPAMTMATGAGAWTAPTVTGGVPSGNYAWFQKTAA